jgi:zinc protease
MNSSKWQQALIDKGLASFTNVTYQTCKYVGPVRVLVLPTPSKLKECHEEVLKQVNMWSDNDYFTDEQLQTAKDILLRNKIRNDEKPSQQASGLTYWWCSASLDYMTDYDGSMQKITRTDIQEYAKKYIIGKPYVAGMIINEQMRNQLKPDEYFKN